MALNVFVSVGTALNPSQEEFVNAVEARLRAIGLNPVTIGRNRFSASAPLRAVSDLMDECRGTVVIALERYRFPEGEERPESSLRAELADVRLPTVWNQIEAAMAYSRGLPLLVLVDQELRTDGLLEKGNEWYVQELCVEPAALNTSTFAGILASWRELLVETQSKDSKKVEPMLTDPAMMTVSQLLGGLKTSQLWAVIGGIVTALGAAFALGAKLI